MELWDTYGSGSGAWEVFQTVEGGVLPRKL
jgi:hypothetical protein